MVLRLLILIFCSLYGISSYSQMRSYEFKDPVPPDEEVVKQVNEKYFGVYENQKGMSYIFNEDGIFSESTLMLSITRATVREHSKYEVRGGYLFGVLKNDSVPYAEDGDSYYYGIKERVKISGNDNSAQLIYAKGSYYINYDESGYYTPVKFTFKGGELIVQYFDYPNETTAFDAITPLKEKLENSIIHVLISPTKREWKKLDHNLIFTEGEIFEKVNEG